MNLVDIMMLPGIGSRLNTPLGLVRLDYGDNIDLVNLLLAKGADVNLSTMKGGDALNVAAAMGNKKICAILLENGADIEAADNEGKTPLINAVYSKKHEVAGFLIEKGADINAKEKNGWSALMFATMGCEVECVKMMIMIGADVNSKTNEGETPLQRALKLQQAGLGDYKEIIEVLKEAGGE